MKEARALFVKILVWTLIAAAAIAVVGGVIGYFTAGMPGLVSALIGAGLAALFAVITVVAILLSQRYSPLAFLGFVMGSWLIKLGLFLVLMLVIRGQDFIDPVVLFASIVAAVVATLAIDAIFVLKARIPYTDSLKSHLE